VCIECGSRLSESSQLRPNLSSPALPYSRALCPSSKFCEAPSLVISILSGRRRFPPRPGVMEHYSYLPLESPHHIRLVHLHPQADEYRVPTVSISQLLFDEHADYEALSYTWDLADDPHENETRRSIIVIPGQRSAHSAPISHHSHSRNV
jgi:hypothetical protein